MSFVLISRSLLFWNVFLTLLLATLDFLTLWLLTLLAQDGQNVSTCRHWKTLGEDEYSQSVQSELLPSSNVSEVARTNSGVSTNMCTKYLTIITTFFWQQLLHRQWKKLTKKDIQKGCNDIEDMREFGSAHNGCPYFTSQAILEAGAQIVFCPYQYVVNPSMRESLGINIENSIVVVDEGQWVVASLSFLLEVPVIDKGRAITLGKATSSSLIGRSEHSLGACGSTY